MVEREILIQRYESPCGTLLLGTLYDQLCLCDWALRPGRAGMDRRLMRGLHARYVEGHSLTHLFAESQLDEYFAGRRSCFSVPLLMVGTPFQKNVWNQLLFQPYGQTLSYCELAAACGCADAARSVLRAVEANALSVFVPCHRIVGKDQSLAGYGGGVDAQFYLLHFEAYMSVHSTFDADCAPLP